MSAINIGNIKTALITGYSKGIGKAIALRFAKEGYNLVINGSKDKEKLEETKAEIEKFNVACLAFLGDMGDYHKVKELFKLIKEEFGHLDVLVNNAGISYVGLLSDMTWQDWDKVIRTNLTSVYNCCSLAIPNMVQKKRARLLIYPQSGAM